MHGPRRVWLLFALFLTLAAGGLAWLTLKTLQVDRAESAARAKNDRDERVRLALWRMDAFLMPLLVEEASRPEFVYSPSYEYTLNADLNLTPPSGIALQRDNSNSDNQGKVEGASAKSSGGKVGNRNPVSRMRALSPLLRAPPQYVQLHFELEPNGRYRSPQVPVAAERDWSIKQGVPVAQIDGAAERLAELRQRVTYETLTIMLPDVSTLEMLAMSGTQSDSLATESSESHAPRNTPPDIGLPPSGDSPDSPSQRTPSAPPTPTPNPTFPESVPRKTTDSATVDGVASNPPAPRDPFAILNSNNGANRQTGNGLTPPMQAGGANFNAPPQQQVVESFAQQQFVRQQALQQQSLPQGVPATPPSNPGQAATNPASQSAADQQWTNAPVVANNSQNPAMPTQNRSAASQAAMPTGLLTNDLSSRNNIYQAYASQASLNQLNSSWNSQFGVEKGIEGMSRPIWIGDELLLARRVRRGEALIVQGCWIDWDALSARLLLEVLDLVPDAELRAADAIDLAFNGARDTLATLPVELVTPAVAALPSISPPTRVALLLAWTGLLVAASAAGFTLYSVLALSERRAAFVAAVTHELRTPLTTFRMYAEMLAGGMVPGERQPEYLSTLSVEADRLAHLVDNVLQYARLERGRPRVARETLEVTTLVERLAPRLAARADQAGLAFETRIAPSLDGVPLTTDVSAVDQILFNLVDNACKYAANGDDPRLLIDVDQVAANVVFRVCDRGPGIPPAQQRRLFQPFSKTVQEAAVTAPGVGLGLALCKRLARELGGELSFESEAGPGASFRLTLPGRVPSN